jgi:hypothetical protein
MFGSLPSSLAKGYDRLYSSLPLASLDGARLSFPFVWKPWKLTRDYNMADFQEKIWRGSYCYSIAVAVRGNYENLNNDVKGADE